MFTNDRLEAVYQSVHDDPAWEHLRKPGITLVEGYGQRDPEHCRVLIVGEAPGATENARGRPFCGPSGRVLNHLMSVAGLRLDDDQRASVVDGSRKDGASEFRVPTGSPANAFVTNVVKYRPPGNRTPAWTEIENGKVALRREWQALGGPRAIVCVGGVAHSAMSPNSIAPISVVAGQGWYPMADGKTICFSQFHPAFGLRRGANTQDMMTRHWDTMGEMLREEGII